MALCRGFARITGILMPHFGAEMMAPCIARSVVVPVDDGEGGVWLAHRRISDHRGVLYGGAVLKNNLEQFFAPRPVTGHSTPWRLEWLPVLAVTG